MRNYDEVLRHLRFARDNDSFQQRRVIIELLDGDTGTRVLADCLASANVNGDEDWRIVLNRTIQLIETYGHRVR